MLSAISGCVTLVYLVVSGTLGVRLLRMARRTSAAGAEAPPERLLGLFFVLYSCIGAGSNVAVYAGWADTRLALPEPLEQLLHGVFICVGSAGLIALLLFTRRLFRPADGWAWPLVLGVTSLLGLGAAVMGVTEGFRVYVMNGVGYWIQFLAREAVFVWIAAESLLYWGRLRLRLRLGLAEPLLANRFLLIGLWGVALAVLAWVDPVARTWYWRATGTTEVWLPEVGAPILKACTAVSTGFLTLSMTTLLLAFFPGQRYAGWIERRAQARSDARE